MLLLGINACLHGWGTESVYGAFNPFQASVTFYIEISHFICSANQMVGFYMECKTGLKLS